MRTYLDHNATTPVRPEVIEAMTASLRDGWGNPSSVYEEGTRARAALEAARARVAALLGTMPSAVCFTAGATEANNTLLRGWLRAGDHVVTTAVEHPSVDEPLGALEDERGVAVTRVAPDAAGCVDAEAVASAIRPETRLVSVIWANNETGSLQPVEAIAEHCRARGIALHSDATQAVGKAPVDLAQVPVGFLSSSAHKLGGPKGVGALVSQGDRILPPLLQGGGQERGRRGGTENVAGIVGFGVACALAQAELEERIARHRRLRDRLFAGLQRRVAGVCWNGDPARQLTNTLNVEIEGVAGEVLVQALDLEGVAVSAGAACHSGAISPSRVLTAMGRSPEQARASLRLSVGHGVDEAGIDHAVDRIATLVPKIREVGAP
jgi:cysteine desulfurase